jgi:hypothetical protein
VNRSDSIVVASHPSHHVFHCDSRRSRLRLKHDFPVNFLSLLSPRLLCCIVQHFLARGNFQATRLEEFWLLLFGLELLGLESVQHIGLYIHGRGGGNTRQFGWEKCSNC